MASAIQCPADVLVKDGEFCVVADSTGFVCTQASLYYQTRRGRLCTGWRKGAYVVGCASQAVLGAVRAGRPGSDVSHARTLRSRGRRYALVSERGDCVQVFMGEAGFDGRSVGDGDLVAVVARGGRMVDEARLRRKALVESARLEGGVWSALEGGDGSLGDETEVWGGDSLWSGSVATSGGVAVGGGVQPALAVVLFCAAGEGNVVPMFLIFATEHFYLITARR